MTDPHKPIAIIERTDSMSPVVKAGLEILRNSPSPETLAKLLDVQRAWDADQARKQYALAMVELKAELPAVLARDKEVKFLQTNYRHTTLGAATGEITPYLTRHGFSLSWEQDSDRPDNKIAVTAILLHAGGHSERNTLISALYTPKTSMDIVQRVGATVTMLQRYTALSLLGIATADALEPGDPPSPQAIDSARNLKAVAYAVKRGKTKDQAEEFLGRPVPEWTSDDLDKLKEWLAK